MRSVGSQEGSLGRGGGGEGGGRGALASRLPRWAPAETAQPTGGVRQAWDPPAPTVTALRCSVRGHPRPALPGCRSGAKWARKPESPQARKHRRWQLEFREVQVHGGGHTVRWGQHVLRPKGPLLRYFFFSCQSHFLSTCCIQSSLQAGFEDLK